MIRKQKVKEICDRYNLEQFIKMDFKLEIGPESAYFVLKNRIKKKNDGIRLSVSKASFGQDRLCTVGEESDNYYSGASSVNIRSVEETPVGELVDSENSANGIEQKML